MLATGRAIGGVFFTNGPIAHVLRKCHYVGEINHKGQSCQSGAPASWIEAQGYDG